MKTKSGMKLACILTLLVVMSAPSVFAKDSEKTKLGEQANPCGCRVSDQGKANQSAASSDSKAGDQKTNAAQVAR